MENAIAVARLENYETRLYFELANLLSNGARRISYDDLAEKIGCARSTVRYNVGKLLSADVIGIKDGKLYLKS